jgi:hypothetical protein
MPATAMSRVVRFIENDSIAACFKSRNGRMFRTWDALAS